MSRVPVGAKTGRAGTIHTAALSSAAGGTGKRMACANVWQREMNQRRQHSAEFKVRPRRRRSAPEVWGQRFAYLLWDMEIVRPNQAWCADITYLAMRGGFMYLTVVLDGYSRKALGWCLSNTLDTGGYLGTFEMAVAATGAPSGDPGHRPGLSVHFRGMDRAGGSWRHADEHGRQRPLAGQHCRGAALVVAGR